MNANYNAYDEINTICDVSVQVQYRKVHQDKCNFGKNVYKVLYFVLYKPYIKGISQSMKAIF